MRTSLNEIKAIEDHLFNRNHPADSLLFQANIILNTKLRDNVVLQQSTYQTVQQYGRKQLKAEIEAVHQKLMNKPSNFMQRLMHLFKK
jgi:hypothetical protein